jgi:long-chain acyl-CoA synthetase
MCSNSYRYRHEVYTAISEICEMIEYDDVDISDTYIDNANLQNSSNISESIDSKAPISILFTSGSTSTPTGVILSQESYVLNAEQIGGYIGVNEKDKYLQILPFHYIAGQITSVLTPLLFGADLIISNSMDPSIILFW